MSLGIFLQERKPTISKEFNGLSISRSLSKMAYARLQRYRRWCIALLKSHCNHSQVSIVVTNEICKITMMKVAGAYLGFVNTITMTWNGCHSVSNQMQIKASHYWPLARGTHQWSIKRSYIMASSHAKWRLLCQLWRKIPWKFFIRISLRQSLILCAYFIISSHWQQWTWTRQEKGFSTCLSR